MRAKLRVFLCVAALIVLPAPRFVILILDGEWWLAAVEAFWGAALLYAPFWIFRMVRLRCYLATLLPVYLIFNVPMIFHDAIFSSWYPPGIFAMVFDTDSSEAYELLIERWHATALCVVYILLAVGLVAMAPRRLSPVRPLLSNLSAIFLATTVFAIQTIKPFYHIYPLNQVPGLTHAMQEKRQLQKILNFRMRFRFEAERREGNYSERETYVIVIGESIRRVNLSAYGYHRETDAVLTGFDGIWHYLDVTSPSVGKAHALAAALTRAVPTDFDPFNHEPSLIGVARELGFETHWLSNQGRLSRTDTIVTAMAREADYRVSTNSSSLVPVHDDALLPKFRQALQSPAKKKLIVLHMLCCHTTYEHRYPPGEARFHSLDPEDVRPGSTHPLNEEALQTINHYDNALSYTFRLLAKIIRATRQQDGESAVIFFPNRGEHLFDTEDLEFGYPYVTSTEGEKEPVSHEVFIPFIVWLSNDIRKNQPELEQAIEANLARRAQLADFFYAGADLLGAEFERMDVRRSFFNEAYQAPVRRPFDAGSGKLRFFE